MRPAAAAIAVLALATGPAPAADGAALYRDHCGACHGENAEGTPNLAPPLVSAVVRAAVAAGRGDYLPRVVLTGLAGRIVVEGQAFVSAMPPQPGLTDEEIAAIATYVLSGLNGLAAQVGPADVATLRAAPVAMTELMAQRGAFAP